MEQDIKSEYIFSVDLDESGAIVLVNEYFVKISGYKLSDVVGKNYSWLMHQDIPKYISDEMWQVLSNGNKWEKIIKSRKSNGGYYWVYTIAFPIENGYRLRQRQAVQSEILKAEDEYGKI
jgi:aerotaxis receptor